jgi:hypothetical protein
VIAAAVSSSTVAPNRAGARARTLEAMSNRELEIVFLRGVMPDLDRLAGWEFRGTNTPAWARLVGIKKFVKGMYRDVHGDVRGYNCPVVQNGLDEPWIFTRPGGRGKKSSKPGASAPGPDDNAPKRFGFYRVEPVDPTSRDNAYLHAVLLDYGRGGNKAWDPMRGLRDYVVQVDAQNDDLFLGKAYYAVGPARVTSNFFVLERHRTGLTDVAVR